MAGSRCPSCKQLTFFTTPTGKECSKCGYKATTPAKADGTGGKGQRCSICKRFTVFDGKCRKCGTKYT